MKISNILLATLSAGIFFTGCTKMQEKAVHEIEKVDSELRPLAALLKQNLEPVPDLKIVEDVRWANQGWSAKESEWFWHVPQGTIIMPYEWFISLEQPSKDGKGLFIEPAYMARYGFIPSAKNDSNNPDGLPIGFVKEESFFDPINNITMPVAGLSCAACHTGQINYNGKGLLIDGGAAMINVTLFQDKVTVTLAETLLSTTKFDRFAKRVLKDAYSEGSKKELKAKMKAFAKRSSAYSSAMILKNLNVVKEGFGRVDALTRIGNVVFGAGINTENLRPISAPVSYPPIWSVPWFDWAQYNGSIRQPMVRNVGEALGVQAIVNLVDKDRLFTSSIPVDNLKNIEDLLAGDEPFTGLQAPKWPEDILGSLDKDKIKHGKKLYKKHCASCHLPPMGSKEIMKAKHWEKPNKFGKSYLITHNIPLEEIGTDGAEVTDFYNRRAHTDGLGLGTMNANDGLRVVTEAVAQRWYKDNNIPQDQWAKWDGFRENKVLRPLAYRARPLNGIWSTPPFLHNGSVPNLYELLSPFTERSKEFYTGSKEFDPIFVGYQTTPFKGGFLMDTTLQGNGNSGHIFDDLPKGDGVIGPKLSKKERWALVEYLKSL